MKKSFKVGDIVRHKWVIETAVIIAVRTAYVPQFGRRKLYTLHFGHDITSAFGIEMNDCEFLGDPLRMA